jgi:hypothetical protein
LNVVRTYQNDRYNDMSAKAVSGSDLVPTLAGIRKIAENTANIIILETPRRKGKVRKITRRQVELCCQKGTIDEGPFRNEKYDWQVTRCRHAAGEELKVVVIVKDGKLIIRSNH